MFAMTETVPPRIYCIPATKAPIVAVFRRGPSSWSSVGCWDLDQSTFTSGAWLKGRIFPRRSDLSPDGRYLCYFAHNHQATWEHGETYIAISKLPWLRALHAFGIGGTWTRGYYFTESRHGEDLVDVDLPIPYGVSAIPIVQFANERRRGWEETADSPGRHPTDRWDEHRNVQLFKQQPGEHRVLYLQSLGRAGGEFGVDQAVDGMSVLYSLKSNKGLEILDNLQWADWGVNGQLLVATRSGKLQAQCFESGNPQVHFEIDLSLVDPHPVSAPPWAQTW